MDAMVIVVTLGLTLVLGVVVGAVPAMQLSGINAGVVLREDNRTGTAGRGARYVRRGLVVAQVALAFMLLISAGLLLASFRELLAMDPGFRAEHVITGRVAPLESKYPDAVALRSYTSRALDRIRALPGVEAAGVSSFLPFSSDSMSWMVIPEGHVMVPGESVVSSNFLSVTPGYLEALHVPLKRGRFFTDSDAPPAPSVGIVDERLARQFWPDGDPIGRRVYVPSTPDDVLKPGPTVVWMRVVGVVGAVKLRGLVEGEDARAGAYYIPYAQDPSRKIGFAIRTKAEADASGITTGIQRALSGIDPEMQLFDTFSLPDRIVKSLNPRKAPMLLSLAFGSVALLLAALGIYGVLAYQVSQRTREIGIRIALGSDGSGILRLVLREGLGLLLLGHAGGLAGAVALRGVIASQLVGVGALDARVLLAVAAVLSAAGVLASLGPARRAARVDPVIALQSS
jgi:predicted permease